MTNTNDTTPDATRGDASTTITIDGTDMVVGTDGAIASFTVNDDGTVTIAHVNGIVRTLSTSHPAIVGMATAMPDAWAFGTGRGNPRVDIIHHGHMTRGGNVRTYVCGACNVRMPATRFPTIHIPTADGRTRNTTECRTCRDDRYAVGRATGVVPDRAAANAGRTAITAIARSFGAA